MKLFCLLFFTIIAHTCAYAQDDSVAQLTQGSLRRSSATGANLWVQGLFVINFLREGADAVAPDDKNNNLCPDFIEDIAKQLVMAHHVFVQRLGFRSPFASPRYFRLRHILVIIRNRQHKLLHGNSGRTFDEMTKHGALLVAVASDIVPSKNATPAHEYFHCIQNAMTFFKNAWYFEGMARWAEDGVAVVPPPQHKNKATLVAMLDDATAQPPLYTLSYKAAKLFWRPFGQLCAGESHVVVDSVMQNMRYSDGAPVMQDSIVRGAQCMRLVLERLDQLDDTAFTVGGYGTWSEANQRNEANNASIAQAVKAVLADLPDERPPAPQE